MSRKLFDATSSNVYYKTFGNFLTSNSFCITAKKIKFSIKGFFSTCDQIHILLRFWSHLLKKSLMENFIFCIVYVLTGVVYYLNWDFWKTFIPTLLSCFFIPWKKYISLGILKITNSFVQKKQTCKNLIYSQASFMRLHF